MKLPITKENLAAWQSFLEDNPDFNPEFIRAISSKVKISQTDTGFVLDISDEITDELMVFAGSLMGHLGKIYQLWSVINGPKDLKKSFQKLMLAINKDVKPEISLSVEELKHIRETAAAVRATEFFRIGHQKVRKTVTRVGINEGKYICAEFSNGEVFQITVVTDRDTESYHLGAKTNIVLAID